eukprot:CAMPEP_0203778032 /NCGR_PEP_ID=MMETSP0099_2-20121227/7746_1 /ASSEMBLY_ACC=CAM_ASM_000209 /TAXON_ID=96639 /ORGANISM=" , Strain NY0313808BC1" /LENGTH=434 /DNA_ID=CAMNT_0050677445 /DNA_START=291 /DNA_END=1592 /DNA_ORIENTATION=-
MSFSSPCETDLVCKHAQVCFKNVSWDRSTEIAGRCICATQWGWVAGDQDACVFGAGSWFLLVTSICTSILLMYLFLVGWKDVLSIFIQQRGKGLGSTLFFTNLCATLSVTLLLTLRILLMATVWSPHLLNLEPGVETDRDNIKVHQYEYHASRLLLFAGMFVFFASLHIGKLWLELCFASRKREYSKKMLRSYTLMVAAVDCLYIVGQVGAAFSLGVQVAILFNIPALLIVFVLTSVCRYIILTKLETKLRRDQFDEAIEPESGVLHDSILNGSFFNKKGGALISTDDQLETALRVVRHIYQTSDRFLIVLVLVIIFSMVYGMIKLPILHPSGWKQFAPSGEIGIFHVIQEIMILAMLCLLVVIIQYCHTYVTSFFEHMNTPEQEEEADVGIISNEESNGLPYRTRLGSVTLETKKKTLGKYMHSFKRFSSEQA